MKDIEKQLKKLNQTSYYIQPFDLPDGRKVYNIFNYQKAPNKYVSVIFDQSLIECALWTKPCNPLYNYDLDDYFVQIIKRYKRVYFALNFIEKHLQG
jgi:hypothetical protein